MSLGHKTSASAVSSSSNPHPVLGPQAREDTGEQEAAGRNGNQSRTQAADPLDLPPELAEELGRLLAQALVADIRQYPTLADIPKRAEDRGSSMSTVESPPGLNRRNGSRQGHGNQRRQHGRRPTRPSPDGSRVAAPV